MNDHSGPSRLSNTAMPDKAFGVCGESIVGRRGTATNWDRVMYCSASCRRTSVAGSRTGFNAESENRDQRGAGSSAHAA